MIEPAMNEDGTYKIVIGDWLTLATAAAAIRNDVFVIEQQVPADMELDDMDAVCQHAVVYDRNGAAVATARLLPDGHIGRMAVRQSARGAGIGTALLQRLIAAAKQRGDTEVVLSAQLHAEAFYAGNGFIREGAEYMDAGIPHVLMRRSTK